MIFVTGDTHGSIDIGKVAEFAEKNPDLTKDDYLIVCGDFGLLWNWDSMGISIDSNPNDKQWTPREVQLAEWYDSLPFTTLFVDGNHENFNRLNAYPVTEWCGGKVHKITDSIIHLMRGQVYDIDGKTVFTFGGAASHDRGPATGTEWLDEGLIWWPEEISSQEERDEAINNLNEHGNSVDLIITHCLSDRHLLAIGYADFNVTTNFLWNVEETVDFKAWYCGHYHRDMQITSKIRCLYQDIVDVSQQR